MKIVRISFERFGKNKETGKEIRKHFALCGDICDDKKLLKKKIDEIIEEVLGK